MTTPQYVRAERIFLSRHPHYNERWVQEQIVADPTLLGLGELDVKDVERMHPRAGRLDLLLQDPETDRRYTVELQLGATDESHIVRTLEYWDIERKRYPQYDHCAVIVAEEVTSRFLNVISLFNGSVPLIAIQMAALQVGPSMTLAFTTVLGELERGLDDDDHAPAEVVDRAFWEAKGSPATVAIADRLLGLVRAFAPQLELRYNKHYIGFAKDGQAFNFAVCRPRRTGFMKVDIRLPQSEGHVQALEQSGLELLDYDKRWGAYRFRLTAADINSHGEMLTEILKAAFDARGV